jgi:hypothetical protein
VPDGPTEGDPHLVPLFEVVTDVEQRRLPRGLLDQRQEGVEFSLHVCPGGARATVPGQLQIYRGRERLRIAGHHSQEVLSLFLTAGAQGEEVVRASMKSGRACVVPVPC